MRGKTTWYSCRLAECVCLVGTLITCSADAADRMGLKQPESPIEQQIVKPLHAGGGHSAEPIGPQSVGFADPGFRAERLYIDTTVIDKTDASVRDTKPLITGIAFVTTGPCEGYAFVPLIGGSVLVLDPSGQQQAVPFISLCDEKTGTCNYSCLGKLTAMRFVCGPLRCFAPLRLCVRVSAR